ncbi:uncharacterized protein I303_105626 [Kwoniella dejecticola CBS 10117]|uniref:Major facilitator superfamily (MFS) profile domain-containing protein n=1 Tax=Kwoniella dejecticola CBS 10117 TaxID=1296121 RepID=A0A1A6A209_9TREE|nr:uncharacterized protein I303_04930 [Kwoniella dejecticola CBS 10117]OBR84074.1 hypothetical protein I303_04930 [Kwoniella dejecticola CBS 10117]
MVDIDPNERTNGFNSTSTSATLIPSDTSPKSNKRSQSVTPLPPGCTWGPTLGLTSRGVVSPARSSEAEAQGLEVEQTRVIWVDFPTASKENPFFFSKRRKLGIMAVALFFANITAFETSSYSIGIPSMRRDLGATALQAATGISLYGWGFAIGPLALAPLTEEFGRYWMYIGSIASYTLVHLTHGLGRNIATVLVGRFLLGITGCIGATVVAGTVADLYPPHKRGAPMSLFTLSVVLGPGLGAATMCWVEANSKLEWRWIAWIQMIACGVYWPIAYFVLRETRASVLLRRKAKKLRVTRGLQDGGRYTARSEVDKEKFWVAMRRSLSRPLLFVTMEPVVTFFAIWAALVWGVFFIQIAGLPYVFNTIYGFGTTASGSTYWAIVIGTVVGYFLNFFQDRLYKRHVARIGVEARLFAPCVAGIVFAVGCIIFGLTSIPSVHWIGPCIGVGIILAAAFTIYQTCFIYLSECYGSHASSAVAGMSFLRILVGSSFAMFTNQIFDTLTPRWGLLMIGCIALVLAPIPFIAFFKGPWIRERSPYSKVLMAEERKRIEAEGLTEGSGDLESRMEDMEGESVMEQTRSRDERDHARPHRGRHEGGHGQDKENHVKDTLDPRPDAGKLQ